MPLAERYSSSISSPLSRRNAPVQVDTDSDQAMVVLESVNHCYGERRALHDVSFTVDRACILALLGPNGSGKTTLFRILTTLLPPSGGVALVGGANVVTERGRVLEQIGVVFQQPGLDGMLTVRENLVCQGHMYGLTGAVLHDRIQELLTLMGLADRSGERVATLSGGLRRRLEVAKAMLHRPNLLILDEPSTGLDPGARQTLMRTLKGLKDTQSMTCLLTTHLMDEAQECDRVAILDDGHLVALDSPDALRNAIGKDVVIVKTAEPHPVVDILRTRFGVDARIVDDTVRFEHDSAPTLMAQLLDAVHTKVESVTVARPSLDDVFVRMTGHRLYDGQVAPPGGASEQ